MYCAHLAENTGSKKIAKNWPSGHYCTTLSGCIFAIKACIDSQKKNLSNSNISSRRPHNMANFGPLTADISLPVWGTAANFNWFCVLVSAATLLIVGQPKFARSLAVSWASTLCIHFCGLLPLMEFCHVQNSLCFQVLHSRILAALLHNIPAAGISQTLRRSTKNGITELLQRAPATLCLKKMDTSQPPSIISTVVVGFQ